MTLQIQRDFSLHTLYLEKKQHVAAEQNLGIWTVLFIGQLCPRSGGGSTLASPWKLGSFGREIHQ